MDTATETDSPARQREDPTITDMLLSEAEVLGYPSQR